MSEGIEAYQWFVLRDLKRPNAKAPAYKILPEMGFETFTPMRWVLKNDPRGGRVREYVPFVHGLLFAKSTKQALDAVISKSATLQFRFIKGVQKTPMIVSATEMDQFIKAVTADLADCIYYSPEDIDPEMLGKKVKIVGGPMDGLVGYLLKHRGARKKRLILQLKDMLVASVVITDGYIQLL